MNFAIVLILESAKNKTAPQKDGHFPTIYKTLIKNKRFILDEILSNKFFKIYAIKYISSK